ncbi:MAG: methyltransferase domain-containing protein [Rudaea sp.]|uniref:methyltransferase domain-containing protein n=1 Tax=Rudaea sp. TaxID=2136325 RepID=UPI0039E4EE55
MYSSAPRFVQGHSRTTGLRCSHRETAMIKFVKCDCGFIVRSDNEDVLVAGLQKHARDHHHMDFSREQVRAMAQVEPDRTTPVPTNADRLRPRFVHNEEQAMATAQTAATFDVAKYKQTTRAQWQDAAHAWNAWGTFLRRWLGPASEIMLDMAGVGPGARVLDVAAGAGDQTLQIAARLGAHGRVLATDIAPAILEFAAANARAAGFRNVETRAMDGEELDVPPASFDAVVSRVGLIYFPDKQRALAGMKRALKPGGRVAAIVYSTPERNGFFSVPVSIIRRRANLPSPLPGQPGPFSLGAPGVLEAALRQAGFRDVQVRAVAAPLEMESTEECLRFERESFGALHQMLSSLDESARTAAWQEIAAALRQFESGGRFVGPCELLVAAGTR